MGLTTLTLVTGIALFFVTGGAATALSIAAGVGLSAVEVDDNIVVLPESADLRLAGHSEVSALNELIEARRKAGLPVSDEMIDNIYIYNEIIPKPRYVNCSRLTSGANTILHE